MCCFITHISHVCVCEIKDLILLRRGQQVAQQCCWFQSVLVHLKIFRTPEMRCSLNLGAAREELSFFFRSCCTEQLWKRPRQHFQPSDLVISFGSLVFLCLQPSLSRTRRGPRGREREGCRRSFDTPVWDGRYCGACQHNQWQTGDQSEDGEPSAAFGLLL